MKRLSSKQLKMVRNLASIAGIVVGFLLWSFIPDTFKNSGLFHVGNGETGSKYGVLILLLLQFIAFIPDMGKEEIHTTNPEEQAILVEEQTRKTSERQAITAIFMALVIWVILGMAALLL